MATLFALLILLATSVFCDATNPVDFINPPPAENPSEYPVWPAQSKQRLAWQTAHSTYNIYAIQDGAEGDDDSFSYLIYCMLLHLNIERPHPTCFGHRMLTMKVDTSNGSGLNTYDCKLADQR